MAVKKPTVEEILELLDDAEKRYAESGLVEVWNGDEDFYELNFASKLLLPEEFKEEGIVLPTARDLVDTCVDNTDVFNPRVWVNRKGESDKTKNEQNVLRKFGLGVLYRNNVEATVSPLRVGAKHYWLHGLTVFKTVWDADRWIERPERKTGQSEDDYAKDIDEWRSEHHDSIPIVIQSVNPQSMRFDPYHVEPQFVFEVREEMCFNVKQKFANWSNPKGKDTTGKVQHVSFWTKDWRCELYDREPVLSRKVVKHKYGFIPYVAIETGLGNLDSENDITKRYVGVLRYVKSLLLSESRDYSIGDVILKRTAFPWGYLTGPNAGAVTDIFQKFGEYNPLPDGVEIVDMAPKVPPQALLTWLGVASDYLASHAAPPAVRGLGEEGVRSGADRRLVIAQAATRYQYANEAFKHGVAKVLSNCARIMKNVVPGDMHVWARTPTDEFDILIEKGKMKEPFTFYVEFAPISEEDEYRRHDDLERLFKSGISTLPWVRRQMSNVDPEAMEVEDAVGAIQQSQEFQQIMSQYAAGRLMQALMKRSAADSLEEPPPQFPGAGEMEGQGIMNNLAGGQGQGPGGRMVPPIPNAGGAAQVLQNQMKNQRSGTPMNVMQGVGGGGAQR